MVCFSTQVCVLNGYAFSDDASLCSGDTATMAVAVSGKKIMVPGIVV